MAATYTPIASITLGAAAASVTFSSIPSTYTDLVVICNTGTTVGGTNATFRVNSDTGSNYSTTRLIGNGSTAISARDTSGTMGYFSVLSSSGNVDSNYIVHFMNYSNTTTNKTVINRGNNAASATSVNVSLWRNTAAITSISFGAEFTANLVSGSTFNLYGILGANA